MTPSTRSTRGHHGHRRVLAVAAVVAVVMAACTSTATPDVGSPVAASGAGPSDAPASAEAPSGTTSPPPIEDYPDAITRRLNRMATEPRPVDNSAMPPRHLDEEQFPTSLVERTRIVSGGVPPDGIPPLADPAFEPVSEVDWLTPGEAVLALELDGLARAYPVRVMVWHEVVNHELASIPVTVTYCPLCNSALAYDRRTEFGTLDFGTSGALYRSALVMYDRQTESLWTHFDGRAVIGTLAGAELDRLPVATVSWDEFRRAHPDGQVLSLETGYQRDYGRNPYVGYETIEAPLTGFFTGDPDPRLPAMERVVGLDSGGDAAAIPTVHLRDDGVVDLELDGRPVTVWLAEGMSSPLDDRAVDGGIDVGATGAFFTDRPDDPASFTRQGDVFVDAETGSTWNLLGTALDGPLAGHQLEPVLHLDTFWFAWSSHLPDTRLVAGPS